MSNPNICPKCQSEKRIRGVRFIDKNDSFDRNAVLEISKHPEALVFRGTQHFPIEADVCGECGFVELYVKSPRDFWEAVEKQ